jgi:hypothetical protein
MKPTWYLPAAWGAALASSLLKLAVPSLSLEFGLGVILGAVALGGLFAAAAALDRQRR